WAGGRDLTRSARYASSDPNVAHVDERGYVTPAGDGSARIAITRGGGKTNVEVPVSGCRQARPLGLKTEVVPIPSQFGSHAARWHGRAGGKTGLNLSLFGSAAAFDHEATAREAGGRRVFPASPAQSLLLMKATGRVPHGGGKRLDEGGE